MEHKFQKCKNHCCRPRGSGSMCNWTNLSNLFFQTFFSFFSRTSSSLNYCWTWTPEPTKMVFTFLESVLQDGEFEYFWRSVRPLELKLCELKKESIFDDFNFFSSFLRLYELLNGGSHRPPKVLKLFVLTHRFQICKNNYCRPNSSGDIAFQSGCA